MFQRRERRLSRLEDAGAEHFVVAKGFELGLEDVDHSAQIDTDNCLPADTGRQ